MLVKNSFLIYTLLDKWHSSLSCSKSRACKDMFSSISLGRRLCSTSSTFTDGKWCLWIDWFSSQKSSFIFYAKRYHSTHLERKSLGCSGNYGKPFPCFSILNNICSTENINEVQKQMDSKFWTLQTQNALICCVLWIHVILQVIISLLNH